MEFPELQCPFEKQNVLRCLVRTLNGDFLLPTKLYWLRPLLVEANLNQIANYKVHHPYCYITVRHGEVTSVTDDEWHVDGFSMNVTHLPEQNYIWVDKIPTEYLAKKFFIPTTFNPREHNLQWFFQDRIRSESIIKTIEEKSLYCFDPYIVHRRPKVSEGTIRTFVRISFIPIEIQDVNNSFNPMIPTNYTRDGVKDLRNNLKRFV